MTKYNPEIHHRKSVRLKHCDYSQAGAYFVSICAVDGEMILNDAGEIVRDEWLKTKIIRSEIKLDTFVVMPNHLHGIVIINNYRRGDRPVAPTMVAIIEQPIKPTGPKPESIGSFIAGFKSIITKRINQIRQTPGIPVWQRNYYEHIIRNETELNKIREYIATNPLISEIIYEVKAATNIHEIKNLKKIQEEKSYFPSIRISKYLPVRCTQTGTASRNFNPAPVLHSCFNSGLCSQPQ